jgi:hypothetical protein
MGSGFINHKWPHPHAMDARVCTLTCGTDRHGKTGTWLSIAGEWVRLEPNEASRLFKKYQQARQLRKQWESECANGQSTPDSK